MIRLEYFNGINWMPAASYPFYDEEIAWISLGKDNFNYRTIDEDTGKVLTDKSKNNEENTLRNVKKCHDN